ncbi:MAG: hypothetical protein K2M19_05285 [Muribaculaceae bacterium]|nr:hypothetical protein [Muribaculaceae bacterium]
MTATLVPIFVCVVLPVAIVAIVFAAAMNNDNKRAKVLIKAIESNSGIDADKLAEALQKPKKTAREILNLRLLRGCIFSFIGLALCIVGFVSFYCIGALSEDFVTVPLVFGGASLAIGLSYLVVYFVTCKQIKD